MLIYRRLIRTRRLGSCSRRRSHASSATQSPGEIMTTRTVTSVLSPSLGEVEVELTTTGAGHPVLLLHGGGGLQTVAGFADTLASAREATVFVPTHPGFGGTARPDTVSTAKDLA